jgi:hypothetical protein
MDPVLAAKLQVLRGDSLGNALPAVQSHNQALEQALNAEGNAPQQQRAAPAPAPTGGGGSDADEIAALYREAQALRAKQGLPPETAARRPAPAPQPSLFDQIRSLLGR